MTQPSSRFPTGRYPSSWWQLYEATILEQDDERLPARIQSAVRAVNTRHVELEGTQNDGRERTALIEARNVLAVLEILRDAEKEQSPPKAAA
jgi:hypothetical protein